MDVAESDQDVSSYMENDDENSSEEDSEEESDDDDDANEDEDGTDAISEGEDEDGTDALSEEDDEETVSDDGNRSEAASAVEEASYQEDLPNMEDPDISCPICLNEFAGQDLGSPENCSHTFCFECILEWSKNINTCPIDRIEFHLIYMKQEINGDVIKKVKVQVKREVEEYVEEVTLCQVCRLGDREDRLLLCDSCDSGYHCECLDPPLETIPIEEWFCPPCSQALNRRASSPQASHSRLIARTSASEIVRSRIQHHRTTNSADSGSETTQESSRVRSPARAPKRRKTSKRKTKRKKTTSKSKKSLCRTKATTAGKSKVKKGSSKASTKRKRKTKRRKTTKKKKKSRKSWLASMKLVAPSVKKRIANHLGLCKPPPGQSMPYVKKSGGQRVSFAEQPSSLDVLGCRDQLFDFSESSYTDDDLDNPKPSTSKQRSQDIASRSSMAVASTSGINLLDNILEKQNDLLRNSKNITIGKDGSLSRNEKSSVKVKCGVTSVKNEPNNDESPLEQSKPTASSSSSMYVQKEKDVSATDSANMKKNISEGTSLVSALSRAANKEKPYLPPRVRFNDTETVFRITNDDADVQIGKKVFSTPAEGEHNVLCLSPTMEGKEDIPHEKASVSVRKEKAEDGLLLHSLMGIESVNTEQTMATSLDVNRENKDHKVNVKELHKDSPLSFSSRTCRENVGSVIGTSTNRLNFSCSTDNSNSPKNVSSCDSPKSVCVKMGDTSSSLFDKAVIGRKRHLPFLPNGLHRPFKIPKLAKRTDKNLASEIKVLPPEGTNNDLNIKVLTEVENVGGNLISEELLSNNKTSQCDMKVKNRHQKHTSGGLNEPMDVKVHGDQSNSSSATTNSLLQASKQEKVKELYKSHKKSDLNSKILLQTMSELSGSQNGHSSGDGYNSEGTGNTFHKVVSHASPSGLNPGFTKCDRKSHDHVATSSSKGVKSMEQKHSLTVNSSEVKTSKPTKKSSTVGSTELKASSKMPDKHKLKEDIVAEIKKHLKDFYVTELITKEEYKEIMRRCVPKVFLNCGNNIDSEKIRKLVVDYVHMIGNTKTDSS